MILFGALLLHRRLSRRRESRDRAPLSPNAPGLTRMLVEELVLLVKRRDVRD
jgi:hypothetical protein